jgi:hypothetical protein
MSAQGEGCYNCNANRTKKKPQSIRIGASKKRSGNVLLSHTVTRAVPSALEVLTSEFEMEIGCGPSAIVAGNRNCVSRVVQKLVFDS